MSSLLLEAGSRPGHLGELTRIVPLVDAALAETRARQQRVRALPSRVVVYLLLAAGLFDGLGYRQVWAARVKAGRRLPILRRLPDESWISRMGRVTVRVIRAEITISTSAGSRSEVYQLVTTLTDPDPVAGYPAHEMITSSCPPAGYAPTPGGQTSDLQLRRQQQEGTPPRTQPQKQPSAAASSRPPALDNPAPRRK